MVVIGNTDTDIPVSDTLNIRLGKLENAIVATDNKVDSLSSSVDTKEAALKQTDASLADSLSSYQQEVVEFDSRINTNSNNISSLDTELTNFKDSVANKVDTEEVVANDLTSSTATITELTTDKATITNLKTTSLEASTINDLDELNTTNLTTSQINTDTLSGRIVQATQEVYTPTIRLESIQSIQSYSSTGYLSSEYVEHYTINPHSSNFIMYSTDPTNQWSISWNGSVNWNEPSLDLQYVGITANEDQVVIDLYIYHPQKELNYKLITLGDDEVEFSYETVKIPYDERNITTTNGTFPFGSGSGNAQIYFVNDLPDDPLSNTLYVIEHRGTFVYNNDTWIQLDPFYLDSNTEKTDPIVVEYDDDTATMKVRTTYATEEDIDLSFVRV